MSTLTEKQLRNRKYYLFLPALVLPFITIGFWLLGGGSVQAETVVKRTGLNLRLPDAQLGKDSTKDKLAFYEQADADSAKRSEELKRDPYTTSQNSPFITKQEPADLPIYERVRSIREKIKPSSMMSAQAEGFETDKIVSNVKPQNQQREEDPEMAAINQTLDKLMALQKAPVQENTKPKISPNAFTVQAGIAYDESYFGKKDTAGTKGRFFNGESHTATSENGFSAIIPFSQVVHTGSVIQLQLLQAIVINGQSLPAGRSLFGLVSIENNRLFISIPSVRIGKDILPVALSVYDLDGLEGLNVPLSDTREVLKSTIDQNLQSVNVLSLDPSIKTQAAIAGISAAKSLLSRKARSVNATISSGYSVLLKNNKNQ